MVRFLLQIITIGKAQIFFCSPARGAHHRLVISSISSEARVSYPCRFEFTPSETAIYFKQDAKQLLKSHRPKNVFTQKWRASWALISFESHRSFSSAPSQLICGRERKKNAAQHLLFFPQLCSWLRTARRQPSHQTANMQYFPTCIDFPAIFQHLPRPRANPEPSVSSVQIGISPS